MREIVGWRAWSLSVGDARLRPLVWAWSNDWETVEAVAWCHQGRCPSPPGRGCHCGLWALPDLRSCVVRAQDELGHWVTSPDDSVVIGAVRARGEVAIHGDEGFRAERARVLFLLSDHPYDAVLREVLLRRHLPREALLEKVARAKRRALPVDLERRRHVRMTGQRYGVPVVSVEDGIRGRLFEEFGLGTEAIT